MLHTGNETRNSGGNTLGTSKTTNNNICSCDVLYGNSPDLTRKIIYISVTKAGNLPGNVMCVRHRCHHSVFTDVSQRVTIHLRGNGTYPGDVINNKTPLATESTKEHGNITSKAFILPCFPWIPRQNVLINPFRFLFLWSAELIQ